MRDPAPLAILLESSKHFVYLPAQLGRSPGVNDVADQLSLVHGAVLGNCYGRSVA